MRKLDAAKIEIEMRDFLREGKIDPSDKDMVMAVLSPMFARLVRKGLVGPEHRQAFFDSAKIQYWLSGVL